MASIPSAVEEQAIQEEGLVSGPSNPMAQEGRDSSANMPSRLGFVLGAIAVGLVLVLALVFGFWLLRSVK